MPADGASPVSQKPATRGRAFAFALAVASPWVAGCARYVPGTLPAVRAISQDAAWAGDAAISPDGKQVAYVSEHEDGRRGLFVRPVRGGPTRALVVGGADVARPTWFPDGRRILFTRLEAEGGRLYALDVQGGAPRALGVPGADVSDASPDAAGASVAAVARDDSSASLVVTRLADFAITTIVRGGRNDAPSHPAWLPKDGGLVFAWRGDLWWSAATGGAPTCLTPGPAHEFDPAVSPDGRWIAFASDSTGPANLWIARLTRGRGRGAGAALGLGAWRPVTATFESARRPTWERSGKALWFDRQDPWVVVARDFEGGDADTLSSSLFDACEPSSSGDGSHVVFSSNRNGAGDVWLLDARGEANSGPARQLTRDPAIEHGPNLSKASGQVAYVSERSGASNLGLTDVVGSDLGMITEGVAHDVDPAWSPDGRALAFASDRSGSFELYRLDGVGRALSALTANSPAGGARQPCWTSDGRALLYAAAYQGRRSIWRMPSTGGAAIALSNDAVDGSWDAEPAASPDGTRALFTRVRRGDADLWALDLTTGEARVWLENPKGLDRHADWSPDGRRVVWQSGGAVNLERADLTSLLRP